MTRREKTISIVVLSMVGAVGAFLAANRLVLGRIRGYDQEEKTLRDSIGKLRGEVAALEGQKSRYAVLRDRTYADEPTDARGRARLRLSMITMLAGLSENRVQLSPTSEGGTRNRFGEAAVNVTGDGSLERLTNLLFLLSRDPYLHTVATLDVTPKDDGQDFSFSLRYASPVFDWKPPVRVPPRKPLPEEMTEPPALTHEDRPAYDVIARRNVFRPYIPPRVAAAAPPPRYEPPRRDIYRPPPPVEPRTDPLDRMVVSALPSTGTAPEVHVQVPGEPEARVFKLGEKLPIGEIALVDYRPMPSPDDPDKMSLSRVIVRMGKDYRAVELEQPLGKWRALRPSELPEQLRPQPETQPDTDKPDTDESTPEPAEATSRPAASE